MSGRGSRGDPGNEEGAARSGRLAILDFGPVLCGILFFGVVLYSMVWYGMVCYPRLWSGVVWFGILDFTFDGAV